MDNELQRIEPMAKTLAATGVSQTLSFCMERKYLQDIVSEKNPLFELEVIPSTSPSQATWIEINQVGRPLDKSAESCFTAIQKILYSCFLPKELQLLFLVTGSEGKNKLYLGLRSPHEATPSKSMVRNLNEFIKGIWPGLQTSIVSEDDPTLVRFKQNVTEERFEYIHALTGIPSMESQYKTLYPATIDKLIAGTKQCKEFAYLIVADPIDQNDAEGMLFECREMNGQAESLKSMTVTQGISKSLSESISHTFGTSHSTTDGTSVTERKLNKAGKFVAFGAAGLGISAAASFFPAASAVVESTMASAAAGVMGMLGLGSLMPMFMKQKQISHSETSGTNESDTQSQSKSLSNSENLSQNIVNKHIEAVSDKLFYHSNRIDTGKAIGLWKVGAYIMADKKSELQGAGLQLRSILSGQETIFEPIRIHDITDILDEDQEKGHSYRELTIGNIASPTIVINNANSGKRFDHPLGEHFKELKTVLTTKELSYYINFPLRSVPGISVVDSSPEFNLTAQQQVEDGDIAFGKLLYGGSETSMPYHIPLRALSRHILLSGINGSGKTNTVQAILNHVGELPFLVIEPAKTEYVDWALEHNKKYPDSPIDIYIPGCKKYKGNFVPKPLRLNPFEIVWLDKEQESNVLTHIDRLKSVFASAFPMYDILPVLMEDLIYTVYQNKSTNWLGEEPVFGVTKAPTLNSMSVCVDQVIEHRQYEDKVQRNMKACLNTRIDSLKRGWKGEMLNTLKSTPWDKLFNRRVLINLSYVGDDTDKAFFMALVLQFLYEYRTAAAELGRVDFNDNSCKHLTVIEEAHRVMSKCENQELPQYKSAMMFSNMLSEIRAYGEGLMLVDQVPTRLIPDAIKNTNLKITHRLVAEDDCKEIGQSMGLNEEQRKVIPKLLTGQCVVSSSLETNAYWVKADKVK